MSAHSSAKDPNAPYRFAFVMEQNLGHRTHYANLRRFVGADAGVAPVWLPIEFAPSSGLERLPGVRGNWSARASLAAWRAVAQAQRGQPLDAVLYHTQVTALLAPLHRGAAPYVISLDATPLNYDSVGAEYGHLAGGALEPLKYAAHRLAFARAAAFITWRAWARDSLARDYGVPAEKIAVIAPGVDLLGWPRRDPRAALARASAVPSRLPQLLFVGGDFARKGGAVLLDCYRRFLRGACELHLVTQAPVAEEPGVHVYRDITPNSEALRRRYAEADIFVFPSLADCAPLALAEAMAAALPIVTTRVGAIPELVHDGEEGLLVAPGDAEALAHAITTLLADPELRARMGERGRRTAEAEHDAQRNARLLLDVLKGVAQRPRVRSARHVIEQERRTGGRSASRVLLVISAQPTPQLRKEIAAGAQPRRDFDALREALGARLGAGAVDTLFRDDAQRSPLGWLLARALGPRAALAWVAFRRRAAYQTIYTDGENIGLPLALLLTLARATPGQPRHVMLGHYLSPRPKRLLLRLGVGRRVDTLIVHSAAQRALAVEQLGMPAARVALLPYGVDERFWRPLATTGCEGRDRADAPEAARPMICSAGLEFRDYATLVNAARGLDVEVRIAAGSAWSRHRAFYGSGQLQPNIVVQGYGAAPPRDLYACARFVALPLFDVDNQAGITVVLEAMAMGKAVILSATRGQTDTLRDRRNEGRGDVARLWRPGFLDAPEGDPALARLPTGFYVTPGDAGELRRAIVYLLEHPEVAGELGRNGRRVVEAVFTLDAFARRLAGVIAPQQGEDTG